THLAAVLALAGCRTEATVHREAITEATRGGHTHGLLATVEPTAHGHGKALAFPGQHGGHGVGDGDTRHGLVVVVVHLAVQPAELIHVDRVGAVDTGRHIGDAALAARCPHREGVVLVGDGAVADSHRVVGVGLGVVAHRRGIVVARLRTGTDCRRVGPGGVGAATHRGAVDARGAGAATKGAGVEASTLGATAHGDGPFVGGMGVAAGCQRGLAGGHRALAGGGGA